MKIYVVYFRTMQNSPEVEIRCVTANKELADTKFREAKKEEEEWMADEEDGSGDWAESCVQSYDLDAKTGDTIYLLIRTEWHEFVGTSIIPFVRKEDAERILSEIKEDYQEQYPNLTPYDGNDEMHLEDPSVAIDVYFSVEPVTVQ